MCFIVWDLFAYIKRLKISKFVAKVLISEAVTYVT